MMDEDKLKPFRLVVKTVTPVVITEFAPNLDGIIFASLEQVYPGRPAAERIDIMKGFLLFNDDLQCFHSSCLRFVVTPEQGLVAKSYVRNDRLDNKLSSDLYRTANGKYPKVTIAGGPTKKRMSERSSYESSIYSFDGVGCAETIKRLLLRTFVGIGYDSFNVGNGEIIHIDIIQLESDTSLVVGNNARRNLPAGFCQANGISGRSSTSRLLPPYYLKDGAIDAISPLRIDAIASNNLFKLI
jgi:hypothetical protein